MLRVLISIGLLALSHPLLALGPIRVIVSIRKSGAPRITVVGEPESISQERLKAEIGKRKGERWMIYIHGFSASAVKSLDRVDKLSNSGQFNVLYLDWPSGSAVWSILPCYTNKKYQAASKSGRTFAPILRDLFWSPETGELQVSELDLVAHSMGCETSREILGQQGVPRGIHEVVLIAPCTYANQFEQDLQIINPKVDRVTAYGSTIDKVLAAGHFGNLGHHKDSRALGTLHREKDPSAKYDFINVTCQYPDISWLNLFYDHFPESSDFDKDIEQVLAHVPIKARTPKLFWVQYRYKNLFGFQLWNMGDPGPPCTKKEANSLTALPIP